MAKTLKEKNVLGHTIFLSINAVALIGVLKVQDILAQGWTSLWADLEQIVGGAALPFLVHIINGLVSADNKARLVFWRWRHPLPGTRAFSEILHSDSRVQPKMVVERLGPLPVDPGEQNRQWYQFYKTVQEVPKVADVHRLFLLARDYTAFSALFLLAAIPFLVLWLVPLRDASIYIGILVVQYLSASQAGRVYGNRFVATVLAQA